MGTHYRGTPREERALDAYVKLARCVDTLDARLKAALSDEGMTLPQLGVLEALLHLGPLCQRELGRKLLRTGGSVTSVVDLLERKGWVRRQRSRADRRVSEVHLTAAGRARIARVFPGHVERLVACLAPLTAAEQRELARLCRELGRGAADAGGPPDSV